MAEPQAAAQEAAAPRASITDSPWYWVYLFATAGLIVLMFAGPKIARRQTQIERTAQGRQRATQLVSGKEPTTPLSEVENTQVTLRPLYLVLGLLLAVAWINLGWRHFRRPSQFAQTS